MSKPKEAPVKLVDLYYTNGYRHKQQLYVDGVCVAEAPMLTAAAVLEVLCAEFFGAGGFQTSAMITSLTTRKSR